MPKNRCDEYFVGKPPAMEGGELSSPWKTREQSESEIGMMAICWAVESTPSAENVAARLLLIEQRLMEVESGKPQSIATVASSLACRDLSVIKPIPVTIEPDGEGGFIASFMDAGIASGGETIPEAFQSLQSIIAASFRTLVKMDEKDLGPKKQRERLVLLEFVCLRSQRHTLKISPRS